MTTPSAPPAAAPAQPDPRRWLALGALVASTLVIGFDITVLNVALPSMAAQIHANTGDLQWIVDAYTVVFAAAMLPAGLLGDRFGRRRMLVAGLAVFLAGALIGTLAHSTGPVIAARSVMGLGGAFVMPLALSVIPSLFGPAERPKAVAITSTAMALGMPLGPIIGGALLAHFWWGSVFLINIPLVAIGIAACLLLLPETRDPAAPRVDALTTVCAAAGLGAFVYGIIEAPDRGWTAPLVLLPIAASVVLIAGLVLRERGVDRPMLDLALLRRRTFLWNAVAATLVTLILTGLLFVLPSYLQTVLGHGALGTGLRLLPMMGGLMVTARLNGTLVRRFGPRPVISAGLVVLAAAAFLGATTGSGDGYGTCVLWQVPAGLGFGLAVVPSVEGALGALPRERAGSGTGLLQTLRQTGSAIGVAVLGSLLAAGYRDRLDTRHLTASAAHGARDSVIGAHGVAAALGDRALAASANAAYVHGMDVAIAACGGAALAAAVLVAVFLPDPPAAAAAGKGSAPAAPATTSEQERTAGPARHGDRTQAGASMAPPGTDARQ
ncbi:drug resistance transporter, EmrB/QacA subfamily [Actinacidiphila yanglinensis]|uniref:Drug resistance transporter, EmrB/QacA subfamily n=1 Tax=Actinacidiphila yanglinensis TaxID=310779 RepID=A0A1H5UWD7_9ACTN|nr:MFS transporter [Actinacidiphila yanglinensis]SEF79405.1 drug resistance transporter, EmrB/QacA subfamily [Actinacidiphila yanglinensis]